MGKLEFKRLPFGLVIAPKFFHSIISEMFSEIPNVSVFVDDIIIYTKTSDEHLKTLKQVLEALSKNNAIINLEKSEFHKEKIVYLGFEISEGTYRPDKSRLDSFEKWQTPNTKRKLQQLLGKINWYRKFIPNVADKLKHLYGKLGSKSRKITVDENEMKPVKQINDILHKQIKLYIPNLNDEFYIHCDASDFAIGAILSHDKDIIENFSKKLNKCQSNYSIVEKEMYSIFMAIKKWKPLIGGSKITVFTDNKNLINNSSDFSKKLNRWKSFITELNIEFKHIIRSQNIIADELSRNENLKDVINNLMIKSNKTYGPMTLDQFLKHFHIINRHPGINASYLTLRRELFISNQFRRKLKDSIKTCQFCQICKKTSILYGEPSGKISTRKILEDISSDIYGLFDAKDYKHNFNTDKLFLITFTDRCSRFSKCFFTNNITSSELIKSFKKEWLSRFTTPKTFLSDNGNYYTSNKTRTFLNQCNIKQIHSSPFNPTGNSISERINSAISNILRIYKGWDLKIIKVIIENRLNNIVNTSFENTLWNILGNKTAPIEISKKHKRGRHKQVNYKYKEGDQILIRNNKLGKLEDPF
ncbi:Transposon Tf2-8 polyprotein [Dictyocoela muelleri]|nr:Transposon Tf2-8 polyprotein [Dictyocoela muelleri]